MFSNTWPHCWLAYNLQEPMHTARRVPFWRLCWEAESFWFIQQREAIIRQAGCWSGRLIKAWGMVSRASCYTTYQQRREEPMHTARRVPFWGLCWEAEFWVRYSSTIVCRVPFKIFCWEKRMLELLVPCISGISPASKWQLNKNAAQWPHFYYFRGELFIPYSSF